MNEKIDLRPKVLEIIQKNGPVIPRDLVKALGGDTFIIGAVLMQLKDAGKVLVSHTKVGGTPAYYCEGQEEALQTLEKYLNDKEKYAYSLLKERKILRDYGEPTVIRLSLRLIKDFATPLVVEVNGEDEVFWKWYLTPLTEAEELIKEILKTIKPPPHTVKVTAKEEETREIEQKKYAETERNEEVSEEKQETKEDIIEEAPSPSKQKEEIKEEIKEMINKGVAEEPDEELKSIQDALEKETQEIPFNAVQDEEIKKEIIEEKDLRKELKSDEAKEQILTEKEPEKKKEKKISLKKETQQKPKAKEKPKKKAVQKNIKKDSKPKAAKGKQKKEGFFKKIKKLFW